MSKHTLLLQLSIAELDQIIQSSVKKALLNSGIRKNEPRSGKIDIDELCIRYKMKKSTVYNKVSENEIPYIKHGKRLLFDENDIEKWLDSKKRGQAIDSIF